MVQKSGTQNGIEVKREEEILTPLKLNYPLLGRHSAETRRSAQVAACATRPVSTVTPGINLQLRLLEDPSLQPLSIPNLHWHHDAIRDPAPRFIIIITLIALVRYL